MKSMIVHVFKTVFKTLVAELPGTNSTGLHYKVFSILNHAVRSVCASYDLTPPPGHHWYV